MKKIIAIILMTVFVNTALAEVETQNGWPTYLQQWWYVAEPEDIQKFIDNGSDVNARLLTDSEDYQHGASVLQMAAAHSQNPDVIRLLIKAGAKINKKTKSRYYPEDPWEYSTPLDWSLSNSNNDIFKILIENGANDSLDGGFVSSLGKLKSALDYGFVTKAEIKNVYSDAYYNDEYNTSVGKYLATYKPQKPLPLKDVYTNIGHMSCLVTYDKDERSSNKTVKSVINKCNFPIILYVCSVSDSRDAVMNNSGLTTGETIQCGQNNRYFQTVMDIWPGDTYGMQFKGGRFEWFACHIDDSILYNKNKDKRIVSNDRGFACKSHHNPKIIEK